jgi:uncharacterized membrane protein
MKAYIIVILILAILPFFVSIYYYPSFPDNVASHWNAEGEVDGYMGKFWGLFLMPIVGAVIAFLCLLLPNIDPLKKNFKKSQKSFYVFIVFMMLFFIYVYFLTIQWNLGIRFDMTTAITPAIGVLFVVVGFMVGKAKRNWFVGIRTPWTLSSDKVWDRTHELGSKLFIISGILAIVGVFFSEYAIYFIMVPILATVLISFIYSYYIYRKIKK